MAVAHSAPQNSLMSERETAGAIVRMPPLVAVILLASRLAAPAVAQPSLSLSDAIARAKAQNPDALSTAIAEREAAERITQDRAGHYPKVVLAESWQRGNHPVYVFSSLLAQRRFTAADLALDAINHPDATDNFRTSLAVEVPLFNRVTMASVQAASIAREMAASRSRLVGDDLIAAVTDAFGQVLIAAASVRSANTAVDSARTDRELTSNRRDAGRVTDADVLQLDVHLARALELHVQARSQEAIARVRLNQLMGEPLPAMFTLDATPSASEIDIANSMGLEEEAIRNRPDIALAMQNERLAAATVDAAQAAFLPQVAAQAEWELNGNAWNSRTSSWVAGGTVRINLFNGFADKARLAEARELVKRRAIERDKAETMARLDVQIAITRLEAARASEVVGRAAAEQARESRRIIRDRYEQGLTDAAMLLRAADAEQQADTQQIVARVSVLTATVNLQRAIGKP